MPGTYRRADEPQGPEYFVRVLRQQGETRSWGLMRDDSRNGGGVAPVQITREQWHRERLDGAFVPILPDRPQADGVADVWQQTARGTDGGGVRPGTIYEVSQRVKDETTRCPHELSCLTTGKCADRPLCEVESEAGHCNLTLKSRDRVVCPYRLPFGHVQFCRCPTHFAIHDEYGR